MLTQKTAGGPAALRRRGARQRGRQEPPGRRRGPLVGAAEGLKGPAGPSIVGTARVPLIENPLLHSFCMPSI